MIAKLLSGRFILTLIAGVVFGYTACKMILPPEATAAIIVAIVNSYFQRSDRHQISNPQSAIPSQQSTPTS